MVLVYISSRNKYPRNCFHSATFSPRNQASKFALWLRPSRLAEFLGLVPKRISCNKFLGTFGLQVFTSNSAQLSAAWESLLLWLI